MCYYSTSYIRKKILLLINIPLHTLTGVELQSSTAYRSTTLTSMSSTNQTEYLSGYPFQGDVLGLVDLSPCTNFTEMWQNFNYTDPENPTAGGGSVELTNLVTYSQLGAFPTPGFTSEDLPPAKDILPWFGADGEVFQADAYDTKCWNRSLSSPVSCQENCLEYLDLFNATWFNLGDLYCMQSYPEPGYASLQSPVPPNGNVNMILTNQCSQYTYGPKQGADSVTMYTLTDTWGNVYALQSAGTNASTPEEWQSLVESAEYPEGWTVSTENLTEPEIHYSYVIGNDCWLVILKDSAGNAWQQYQYAQPLEQSSFLGSMDCPALAKSGGGPVPAPGPVSGAVRIGGGSATALLHMMLLLLTLLLFMLKR